MGINRKEPEVSEGNSFESALNLYDKDTTSTHHTSDKSEWQKYIDNQIVPTGNPSGIVEKSRPSKDEYYLNIAKSVSERSTCLRIRYGSVIVKNDRIISTGYNGAPKGRPNCCDIGECYRKKHNIQHMTRYETCASVHSEMNAIIAGAFHEMNESTLYLCGIDADTNKYVEADCCMMCKRAIINAGISDVVFRTANGGIKKVKTSEWNNEINY